MAINQNNTPFNKTPEQQAEESAKRLEFLYEKLLTQKQKGIDLTNEEVKSIEKSILELTRQAKLYDKKAAFDKKNLEVVLEYLETQKKINKELEASTSIIAGINNSLSKKLGTKSLFGDIDGITKRMSSSLKGGASSAQALGVGMGTAFKQMQGNLKSPMVQLDLLKKGFDFLHSQFKQIDNDSRDLARSLNLTYDAAAKVRDQLMASANYSNELSATGKSLSKSMVEMNDQLGTTARFDNERLLTYTKLRDVAKFEVAVLEDINRMSLASKQTQLDVTKNRLAQINLSKIQLGRQIDERKVMQDIAKASYNVKINYLGRDKDLAKAATQARALGMELSQTERIAENLLDFENSIKNQMEAELLTGRTLNLERARYFALTNDLVGLQTELNRQGVTAEKFGKMNRIQQNAIAGAMGMSKDEMSKMLIEQKALQNLGVGTLELAQKEYEVAVKNGTVEQYKKKLGNDSLARQFQQQSLQERMTMAVEKMLAAFEKLAVVFRPFYKLFVGFVELLSKSETLLKSIAAIVTIIAAKRLYGMFSGSGSAAAMAGGAGMTASTTAAGGLAGAGGSTVASQAMAGGKRARTVNRMKNAGKGAPITQAATTASQGAPAVSTAATTTSSAGGGPMSSLSKLNPMNALKNAFKGFGPKQFFGQLGKIGLISTLFEGFFANQDIKGMIASGVSKQELNKMVGARVAQAIGSVAGGALLGALLSPIPGGAFIGGLLGSSAGSALANVITDAYGAEGLGEGVLNTFYKGEMKESAVPGLATGGVVEKTGLIKAHAGEVYTGGGTLKMFEGMWQEMKNQNQQLKEQNRYLAAIANKSTVLQLDRQVLATEMGKEVAMSYGNILNPGSQTFS